MKSAVRWMGILVFAISCFMLVNWLAGWTTPLTIIPRTPPLVFNSALAFLCLSLGLLFPKSPVFNRAWLAAMTLALISGLEYIFEINLGIDELFVYGYTWNYLSAPGRMPPPTAFSLLMAGLAQGALFKQRASSHFPWGLLSLLCSSIVTFFGVAGLFYFTAAQITDVPWGDFAKMSVYAAICSILVGTIGIIESRKRLEYREKSPWKTASVFASLSFFFLTFITWEIRLIQNSAQIAEQMRSEVEKRVQVLTRDFQDVVVKIQNMPLPRSVEEVRQKNWSPEVPGAHALVFLGQMPKVIWSLHNTQSERDLRILQEQIRQNPYLSFYHSLAFQRSRWMGVRKDEFLLLFSPSSLITKNFSPNYFHYSLLNEHEILFSNATALPLAPQEWSLQMGLPIQNSLLQLQLDPTPQNLSKLGLSNDLPFLMAGLLLSLAIGVIFHLIPTLKHRFSR